jgi:hypothetical protein
MKISQTKISFNDKKINDISFKINNYSLLKTSHKKILLLFAYMIFASSFILIPNADAFIPGKVVTTATVGSPVVSYRDILDPSIGDSPNVTITTDGTQIGVGIPIKITAIFDSTANLDDSQIDIITIDVIQNGNISQVALTENELNSGVFAGFFTASDLGSISISYNPPASFAGRFQGTFDNVITEGTVIIQDVVIDDFDDSTGIGAVIDSIDLQLGTAEIAPDSGITVTMSYKNALIADPDAFPLDFLCLLHQSQQGASWEVLTYGAAQGGDLLAHNFAEGTITNQLQPTSDGITVDPRGRYVLGFCNLGAPGGGGGGLARPGLVVQALGAVSLLGGGSLDAPPTLGLNQNQKRIVSGGFSFNDNPVDVLQYYTPYPMITTPVGQNNTVKLKIFEEKGLDNIAHVGLSYGLGKGEIFNEGRATIELDRTFDGIESVTLFDPSNVLGDVSVTAADVRCNPKDNFTCLEVTFHHVFREPLEYNMVATNVWDFERNGWQNYFNHGIHVVGESMNPPDTYSGIYHGHVYHLTETGKNTAVDENGDSWTFDIEWTRDYVKPEINNRELFNQKKIDAIEHLGFQYSDGMEIFGYARVDHEFTTSKNLQEKIAHDVMTDLCPQCLNEPYEKINKIFSYELPDRFNKLDNPKVLEIMNSEDQRARQFLQEYFEKIYHKVID